MRNLEVDGHRALGFDTGLDARAFAQAKFAQFITEPGLIICPGEALPQKIQLWKASGVREVTGDDGKPTMVVWGPPVEGERLDALLGEIEQPDKVLAADRALATVSLWIQAVLALGDIPAGIGFTEESLPLWPSAAIITQAAEGRPPSVFFAPPSLIRRSVTYNDEYYVNPALKGMNAAAFTAAAMLYRLFAGTLPFSAADASVLHEDMRDGNFLPPHLAIPGLDSRLAALIKNALDPINFERTNPELIASDKPFGVMFLGEMIEIIPTGGQTVSASSLVHPPPEQDCLLLEKEKAQFLKKKAASVKTRRFIARNTALLLGLMAGAAVAAFIIFNIISTRAQLPTTEGMDPIQVIESYYHAFGNLDYQMMEACVTGDAGKSDITTVINLFVMNKTRQAYEYTTEPFVLPAHLWPGGSLPDTPLFGATDLRVEWLSGDYNGGEIRYRVDYTFWIPAQAADEDEIAEDTLSLSYPRRDYLTFVRKKGNWRIAEITRVLGN